MSFLAPQSMTTTRFLPSPRRRGSRMLTCATRLSAFGSWKSTSSLPKSSLPSMEPAVRRCWVRMRVSTPANPGTPCSLEPRVQRGLTAPVAEVERELGHHQPGDLDRSDSKKLEIPSRRSSPRHPVVADQRIGEHEDLPAIGRIGEGLGIADHPGVEDDLAGHGARGPERFAGDGEAVLEHESSGHRSPLPRKKNVIRQA